MVEARWAYPPIGFVMNMALGTIYSWSVFRLPLENLFKWSTFESGLPFTVFLAFFALTMPIGGKIMNAYGPRKTALGGAVLVGSGWILARFVEYTPNPLVFMLLFYGIVAGIGVGLVYGVPIAISSKWIPERKGLAVGVTILGFGISPLITAITSAYLIEIVGVLNTFLWLGLVFALLLVTLSLPLKFPTLDLQVRSSISEKKAIIHSELTSSQMVRTRSFVGLWLTYVLGTTGGFIAISLAAKYACEVSGLTTAMAAVATSGFAIFNGFGRPIFGYLCDRIAPRRIVMMSFVLIIVAASIAMGADTLIPFLISFALLWFTFGGWLAVAPATTSSFFGLRNLASNYGIVFTAYGVGAIIGPVAASYIRGISQTYAPVFLTTIALAVIGFGVAFFTYPSSREVAAS